MKKFAIYLLVLLALILSACTSTEGPPDATDPKDPSEQPTEPMVKVLTIEPEVGEEFEVRIAVFPYMEDCEVDYIDLDMFVDGDVVTDWTFDRTHQLNPARIVTITVSHDTTESLRFVYTVVCGGEDVEGTPIETTVYVGGKADDNGGDGNDGGDSGDDNNNDDSEADSLGGRISFGLSKDVTFDVYDGEGDLVAEDVGNGDTLEFDWNDTFTAVFDTGNVVVSGITAGDCWRVSASEVRFELLDDESKTCTIDLDDASEEDPDPDPDPDDDEGTWELNVVVADNADFDADDVRFEINDETIEDNDEIEVDAGDYTVDLIEDDEYVITDVDGDCHDHDDDSFVAEVDEDEHNECTVTVSREMGSITFGLTEAVEFDILDEDGDIVASGVENGDTPELPHGEYTARFDDDEVVIDEILENGGGCERVDDDEVEFEINEPYEGTCEIDLDEATVDNGDPDNAADVCSHVVAGIAFLGECFEDSVTISHAGADFAIAVNFSAVCDSTYTQLVNVTANPSFDVFQSTDDDFVKVIDPSALVAGVNYRVRATCYEEGEEADLYTVDVFIS